MLSEVNEAFKEIQFFTLSTEPLRAVRQRNYTSWTVWSPPNELFVERDRAGMNYKPEWGVNPSRKNLLLLRPYMTYHMLPTLR
jgi:hypothetical protein